jgi:hypothetical protein
MNLHEFSNFNPFKLNYFIRNCGNGKYMYSIFQKTYMLASLEELKSIKNQCVTDSTIHELPLVMN